MKIKKQLSIAIIIIVLALSLTILAGCEAPSDTRSVTGAVINENGELVLKYSDGSEDNLGHVVGKDGAPGADGRDGENGDRGLPGKDGADGKDGANGEDGTTDITISIESNDTAIATAVAKGLRSTVSIEAHHTKTVYNILTGTYSNSDYSSEGSGVIYKLNDQTGSAYIITNHHVVYDKNSNTKDGISTNLKVYLYGSEYAAQAFPATYIGGSMTYDIAVLRVENCAALKAEFPAVCDIADSDAISVGETAIAIGNAEGIGIAATSGIISVDSERITMNLADGSGTTNRRVIRIDTSVNHGNSGGPLFNDNGELIGIVSAKIETNTVDNIGYAIPSNVARAVADNIIDNCDGTSCKTVQRASIGVTVTPIDAKAEFDTVTGKTTKRESSKIQKITQGSLADGKLLIGDILVSAAINGATKLITRNHHLIDTMLDLRAGDTLVLNILRDGAEVTVSILISASYIESVK